MEAEAIGAKAELETVCKYTAFTSLIYSVLQKCVVIATVLYINSLSVITDASNENHKV